MLLLQGQYYAKQTCFVTTVNRLPRALPEFFDDFVKLIKAIDNENKEMYILNCNMLKTDRDANILTDIIDKVII